MRMTKRRTGGGDTEEVAELPKGGDGGKLAEIDAILDKVDDVLEATEVPQTNDVVGTDPDEWAADWTEADLGDLDPHPLDAWVTFVSQIVFMEEQPQGCDTCPCGFAQADCVRNGGQGPWSIPDF